VGDGQVSDRTNPIGIALAGLALLSGGGPAQAAANADEQSAHDRYVAAINSNNLDTFVADLTDDVVFQSPGQARIVGKAAVRRRAAAYLAANRTH
jgi:ketosteroid isomerase-like protein